MKHRFRFSREIQGKMEMLSHLKGTTEEPAEPETEEEPVEEKIAPIEIETRTNIGLVRAANQDAVLSGKRFIGIADGMGGHNGGETASAIAKEQAERILNEREPDPTTLGNAVRTANRHIFLKASETPSLNGMGTTLTLLWVGPEMVYIGHVGDSRCYRFRSGELKQITDDHSLVMEMVRAGMLTKEQAAVHPMRNVITRAVGTDSEVEPDITAVVRKPGDIWLVCSDGLHGMISDEKITEILKEHSPGEAADLLIQAALDAGGRDNVSLALLLDREGKDE